MKCTFVYRPQENTQMTVYRNAIASFDVDAQKSFTPLCPNELPVAGGDQIGAELNYMASLAARRVGSKDAHTPHAPWVVQQHSEMLQPTGLAHADVTWVSHCVPGTEGFTLLDELPTPYDYDYFIWKGVEPDRTPTVPATTTCTTSCRLASSSI